MCLSTGGGLLPGDAWSGEGSAPGGVGEMSGPGRGVEAPLTATAAGGTHPTGMYSCY